MIELRGTSDQPMTAVEAMSRIIFAFHPNEEKLSNTEAELLPVYRSVLAGKRALIVLDNAKDEEQVKHLVTVPPPVGFVVTCRNALELDGVESIRLNALPPGEATKLLSGIVKEKGTDNELRRVAQLCGRLHDLMRSVARNAVHHTNAGRAVAESPERLPAPRRRLAEHYFGRLRQAGQRYDLGGENLLAALAQFDRDSHNIRCGQEWACRNRAVDQSATRLAGDYAVVAPCLLYLR